ncbi:unnamed protein product [Bathycoccus prasinos]|mmetsp:Transcript_4686/g.16106  ORF Transcript_4686/g.16106 Transcript_4686/m.16106 type:complete len:292 (-) Transcript_4686:323-1198(-)
MAVTVNALFKKSAPAPAKTVKKTTPAKKAVPAKKPTPAKKAPVTVKKTVKKAAPVKSTVKTADLSKWYGPQRKLYLPSGLLTTADIPSYLDGKLAGDYGFDPLGLGADGAIKQYRVAEVIHARWAMLAVPGIVIPEALNVAGGDWRETGKVFLEGSTGRFGPAELWLGIAVAPLIVLMGGAEKFRSDPASAPSGFVPFKGSFTGSDFAKLDPINPGGPLDFYNVAATPQDLEILKVKEIKNGRLAMIAMLGVFVQGATTGEGPAANWGKHVADPFGYNFVTLNAVDRTPVL